ncbi:MAG TPA: DegT/DnrJ/EryC1/StrS family aminotransferase [Gemmatimonadales bacterium]
MVPEPSGDVIRLARPDIDDSDCRAVAEVLRTGWLVQGSRVAEFERRVAARAGTEHAVAVANCTSALHLALLALDVGPGDAVAVAAYSWPATANVVALCGAEPLFVDIEPVTWAMNPARLAATLAENRRVKAVIPVHTFGGLADLPGLLRAAEPHGVPLVEDAACALGAVLEGRPAGSWGVEGCFSFHPRKVITTGEGGMITTSDAALARKARALRNHGQDPDTPSPDFILPGFNLRLTDFQGAMGVTQMARLDRLLARRREIAGWYAQALTGLGVVLPGALTPESHTYQAYVVLLPAVLADRRAALIARLQTRGIETNIGTHHLPLTTWCRARGGHRPGEFPITDDVARRALALPMHGGVGRAEVERVAERLGAALRWAAT